MKNLVSDIIAQRDIFSAKSPTSRKNRRYNLFDDKKHSLNKRKI